MTTTLDEAPPPPPAPAPELPPPSVRVGCRMPAMVRIVDHWRKADGELIEVAHVWALKGAWRRRPESRDGAWKVVDFGLFVLAYRVTE